MEHHRHSLREVDNIANDIDLIKSNLIKLKGKCQEFETSCVIICKHFFKCGSSVDFNVECKEG